MSSFVAIGDIHGCARTLAKLLDQLDAYSDRTFVFIGDYIDRGPDSKGVVDLCIDFSKSHDCVFLRGNHEQMMIDAILENSYEHWFRNGGKETLASYGIDNPADIRPNSHRDFYATTRLVYDTDEFLFVHGGIPPHVTVADYLSAGLRENVLWERSHVKAKNPNWEKTVVFGHTPVAEVIMEPLKIGIDTGCVYNHHPELSKLSAVLLPEREVISQKNIEL